MNNEEAPLPRTQDYVSWLSAIRERLVWILQSRSVETIHGDASMALTFVDQGQERLMPETPDRVDVQRHLPEWYAALIIEIANQLKDCGERISALSEALLHVDKIPVPDQHGTDAPLSGARTNDEQEFR